jgi:hypothetical protein
MIAPELFNPFPGLRSFEPDEDHLFFGREAQIDELLRLLRKERFLALVGTSGSGKSSLVRAGLIPALHGGAMSGAGSAWRVAILRPGRDPLGKLAEALAAPEALGSAPVPPDRYFLEAGLRASRLGLVESICQARLPPGDRVLVLADQFEELFRFRQSNDQSRDEALAFVRLLLEAAQNEAVPVYVALTMRAEYIGYCMEFPDLPEKINAGLYLVPRLTRDQLREAVVGPIAVGGGRIALRLVHRLLNDVGDDPDQLPILQHALMRTWDWWGGHHHEGEALDLRHYEDVGGMGTALSRHADEAYKDLDPRGQKIAETMFKALTEPGADGRGVRRPVTFGEVCALTGEGLEAVAGVVKRFREPGRSFLTSPEGKGLDAGSVLDISHESLIRVWTKLRDWLKDEARAAREYRDFAAAADRYAGGKGELLSGADLKEAVAWRDRVKPNPVWAWRYDPSFLWTLRFIEESDQEWRRKITDEEKQRRRRRRTALIQMVVAAVVVLGSLGLFLWAVTARNEARQHKDEAERYKAEAKKTDQQAGQARQQAEQARQQAMEALQKAKRAEDLAHVNKAEAEVAGSLAKAALLDAQGRHKEAEQARLDAVAQKAAAAALRSRVEQQEKETTTAKSEAEASKTQARAEEAEATRLKNLAQADQLAGQSLQLQQDPKTLPLAADAAIHAYTLHTQNGKGHEDETFFYRALQTAWSRWAEQDQAAAKADLPKLVDPRKSGIFRLDAAVRALAFDPEETDENRMTLRAGTEDGRVVTLTFKSDTFEPKIGDPHFANGVQALAVGPPGIYAASSPGGSIAFVGPGGFKPLKVDPAWAGKSIPSLAFHRDGWLAAVGANGAVNLWKWQSGQISKSPGLPLSHDPVTCLAFSRASRALAACSAHGVVLWNDVSAGAESLSLATANPVWAVGLSPDGRLLAAGTAGGEVLTWKLTGQEKPIDITSKASPVLAVRFSADGRWLAAARGDGTIQLWKVASLSDPPLTLSGHKSWVWSLDFSANGDWLASASRDGTVRFWPTNVKRFIEDLCTRLREGERSGGIVSKDCSDEKSRVEAHGAMP